MTSFDVKSLILEKTIAITLEQISHREEIETISTKNEMKNLLLLYAKNGHFIFNNGIFIPNDRVVMISPLGPILAGIFMVKLEITLVPKLKQHVYNWKRYVDDTFIYVKNDSIKYVLSKFTYERKVDNTPPFLGVLFIRNSDHLHTTVYREKAFNNLYLHWHSFAPISWTCETFRTLLNRTYVCMFQQ